MPSQTTTGPERVRTQLQKVLSSRGFARNGRLSGFLQFVVEQELSGRGDELKESIIGVEFFGRSPDYDVRQDSVVRNEAGKLRARLAEYYVAEGAEDALVIEMPKGGYKPFFRQIEKGTIPIPVSRPRRSPRSVGIWLAVALAGCGIVSVLLWERIHPRDAPISIAVLPLINLDRNPDHDYFADGLTGEIIRNLSIIEGLAVRSQTSSFAFKGKPQNMHDVGKELHAEYVLEGSVLLSGQMLRIDAQLVRVSDDFALWSGKYDREVTDVFAIQEEISRGIVNGLRLKLGGGRRRYETSVEAYDLYLRARAFEDQTALSGLAKSVPFFEQTIVKDPSFAPAYAGLAVADAGMSGFDRFGENERSEMLSKMRTAAERAINLDPLSAEAHDALGIMHAMDAQWAQSEKSFMRSLQLNPNSSVARDDLILYLLLPLGRIEEAIAQVRMSEKTDPLSPAVQKIFRLLLFSVGRPADAIAHCPQPCAEGLIFQGRAPEAIPILEEKFHDRLSASGSGMLGRAYALAGQRDKAEKMAVIQWRPIEQAGIFAALGDKNRAFEALERAVPLGPVRLGRDLTYAEFAAVRGDPRMKALRKKIGLPE
jgi:adenylate cyclase